MEHLIIDNEIFKSMSPLGYSHYYCNKNGIIYSDLTNSFITLRQKRTDQKPFYVLQNDLKERKFVSRELTICELFWMDESITDPELQPLLNDIRSFYTLPTNSKRLIDFELNLTPGKYLITTSGEVWNCQYKRKVKGAYTKFGHQIVLLENRYYLVHRLVAKAFIPNPNNYPYVDHIDGNPSNNHVENLRWCTQQMNINYAREKGNLYIHSDEKILAIAKDLIEGKLLDKEIAEKYGVNPRYIWQIRSGQVRPELLKDFNLSIHK